MKQVYLNEVAKFLKDLKSNTDFYGEIEAIETERRDGYIPHSHNNGGSTLNLFTTLAQFSGNGEHLGTYASDLIEYQINKAEEYHCECEKIDLDNLTDEQRDDMYQYLDDDTNSVMFQAMMMFTSETTLDVNLYIETSDAPYHRGFDYKFETELTFNSLRELKAELRKIVPQVKQFFMMSISEKGAFEACESRHIYQYTIRKNISEIEGAK